MYYNLVRYVKFGFSFIINNSLLTIICWKLHSLLYSLLSTLSYCLKMIILHSRNIEDLNQTKMIDDALCQLSSEQCQVIDWALLLSIFNLDFLGASLVHWMCPNSEKLIGNLIRNFRSLHGQCFLHSPTIWVFL